MSFLLLLRRHRHDHIHDWGWIELLTLRVTNKPVKVVRYSHTNPTKTTTNKQENKYAAADKYNKHRIQEHDADNFLFIYYLRIVFRRIRHKPKIDSLVNYRY